MADHKTLATIAALSDRQASALAVLRRVGSGTPYSLKLSMATLDSLVKKGLVTRTDFPGAIVSPRTSIRYAIKQAAT